MTAGLDGWRARIAAGDAQLVALVAERLALVRDIGAAKRTGGLPVRSYGTETEVLERLRHVASAHGLDERVADALGEVLIGESVRAQEEAHPRPAVPARRILVVGGAGKMGRWLARFCSVQNGHLPKPLLNVMFPSMMRRYCTPSMTSISERPAVQ